MRPTENLRADRPRRPDGFTILELLLSLTMLMFVLGTAVQFLRRQTNLVAQESTRSDALQNAEFAVSQIERELREAGAGVVDIQPMLVQVDNEALTFNANMVSIDTGDVRAVYQLRDADTAGTRGLMTSEAIALPNSNPTVLYPDTTYFASAGAASGAETISYYFRPDSSAALPNRFVLLRRVNATAPTLVARGLVKDARDSIPFLTYYVSDTLNRLVPLVRSRLPVYHGKIHGAPSDTGRFALPDSIRAVRLHLVAASRDPRTGKDALRVVEKLVRMMNAGLMNRSTCGQPPMGVSAPSVTSSPGGAPVKSATITWSKSGDDTAGEKDIERYAIFRRPSSSSSFGDPISSIPAGSASYSFVDTAVLPGASYVYGIAAQDCTPQLSPVSPPMAITINP